MPQEVGRKHSLETGLNVAVISEKSDETSEERCGTTNLVSLSVVIEGPNATATWCWMELKTKQNLINCDHANSDTLV